MKRLIRLSRHPLFLGTIVFLVTLTFTYLIVQWMRWSMLVYLGITAGLLVIAVVLLAVLLVRSRNATAETQNMLLASVREPSVSPPSDADKGIEELKQNLDDAVHTLKTSALGEQGRGRRALHELPWYMVIGPPGAGKTTLISRSGLHFPSGYDADSGKGGTRTCEWRLADASVFLDTAGRYVTEHDDREWKAFLDMLKTARPGRPVNGVVLSVGVRHLVDEPADQVEDLARQIRKRLDALVEQCGIRIPVYLAVTKCDLLAGFERFFADLSLEERKQVWGHTFSPSDWHGGETRQVFSKAFDRLVDRLTSRRSYRLMQPMHPAERELAYRFPLEFGALRHPLGRFVEKLFRPSPYKEGAILRGVYFTSLKGEEAPDASTSPGVSTNLKPESILFDHSPGSVDGSESKSFFTYDLFENVIVPDRAIAQRTARASRRTWGMQAAQLAAAVLALGLFVYGAYGALKESRDEVAQLHAASRQVNATEWTLARGQLVPFAGASAGQGSMSTVLPAVSQTSGPPTSGPPTSGPQAFRAVDELGQRIEAIGAYDSDRPYLRWGLRQGDVVLGPAQTIYLQSMRRFVVTDPLERIRNRIQEATQQEVLRRVEREALYDDLRAYMLLTTDTDRLVADVEKSFLADHLPRRSRIARVSQSTEQDALTERVRGHMLAFAAGLADGSAQAFAANSSLIGRARTLIYEPPSVGRLYVQMKEEGRARLPVLTLGDILDGRHVQRFTSQPEVPGFFTQAGYESYVKEAIDKETTRPDDIDWVMGYSRGDIPESMTSQDQLAEELKSMYLSDYANAWSEFLSQLRLREARSIRDASDMLTALGNPYDSPLLEVLRVVHDQTSFSPSAADAARERAEALGQRAAERQTRRLAGRAGSLEPDNDEAEMHPVERRFRWLHDLRLDEAERAGSSGIVEALEAMSEVAAVLSDVAGDDREAARYAETVLQDGAGSDLEGAYEAMQSALRRVDARARSALFEAPLLSAWRHVAQSAQRHINDLWRQEVCQPFDRRLAALYPFDPHAGQDVPLSQVEAFFQPVEGTLASFRTQTLDPFLETDSWNTRTWKGEGIRLSQVARREIRRGEDLGARLFNGSVLDVAFSLRADQPETRPGAPVPSRVFLQTNGASLSYDMGHHRPWTSFRWPDSPDAVLQVAVRNGPDLVKRESGSWAWFRLLGKANIQREGPTTYSLRWPMAEDVSALLTLRTTDSDAPYHNLEQFFHFECPSRLD